MKRRIDFAHGNIREKTSRNQDRQAQRLLELPERKESNYIPHRTNLSNGAGYSTFVQLDRIPDWCNRKA
jgi:hypothetical protein